MSRVSITNYKSMVKKIKESKASSRKQKSRAKYICPIELKDLIDQVNLLPPDFQLQDFTSVFVKQRDLIREQTGDIEAMPSVSEVLKVCLEDTPKVFEQYIKSESLNRSQPFGIAKPNMEAVYNFQTMAGVYSEYFVMRNSMLWLLERLEKERQQKATTTSRHITLLDWNVFPLSIKTVLKRGKDGKLQITGLAALIGKFDDSRLRKCEVCSRIYWAKRENSKTCSPECLNKLNVRRHRALTDEEKAERKTKREENRELIKKGKAKPTKRRNRNAIT